MKWQLHNILRISCLTENLLASQEGWSSREVASHLVSVMWGRNDKHLTVREHSPSWEANVPSASQKIPRSLWSLKKHYMIHKIPSPVSNPILRLGKRESTKMKEAVVVCFNVLTRITFEMGRYCTRHRLVVEILTATSQVRLGVNDGMNCQKKKTQLSVNPVSLSSEWNAILRLIYSADNGGKAIIIFIFNYNHLMSEVNIFSKRRRPWK